MTKPTIPGSLPRYERYQDTGIPWLGEIPEGWGLLPLSQHLKERKQKVSDTDFEPLSVTKNGIFKQLENVAKSDDGNNRKLVRKGDFVINSRSDRKGSSGISKYDGSVSLINIVLQIENLNSMFCSYLLKSTGFIEEFYRYGHGIVADLWTTRYWDMKSIKLPIPPLPEQTRIAQFLDRKVALIDEAIAKKERMIALLEERRQIMIQEAVTKGLPREERLKAGLEPEVTYKDSGVDWIGKIPEDWEVKKLKYIGKTQNGISAPGEYFGRGYPFLSYSDVYKNSKLPNYIKGMADSSEKERQQYSILENDVFFTRTSETINEVGFSSVCHYTIRDAVFAGFLIRFRPFKHILNKGFSTFFFRSDFMRSELIRSVNLVTRASLSQDALNNILIAIPSMYEQNLIYNYLKNISDLSKKIIEKQINQITELKAYKETLIDSVVTGKVKVPHLSEAPAAVS